MKLIIPNRRLISVFDSRDNYINKCISCFTLISSKVIAIYTLIFFVWKITFKTLNDSFKTYLNSIDRQIGSTSERMGGSPKTMAHSQWEFLIDLMWYFKVGEFEKEKQCYTKSENSVSAPVKWNKLSLNRLNGKWKWKRVIICESPQGWSHLGCHCPGLRMKVMRVMRARLTERVVLLCCGTDMPVQDTHIALTAGTEE